MKKAESRRQQLLERMADHVLAHGLQGASLRPLAAAAGTSDRMLLHYFADKEALLTATLALVTQRLIAVLELSRADPMPFQRLLPHLAGTIKDARIQPYMRLWLELVTVAAVEKEPFRAIAQGICSSFLNWIAAALQVEPEQERAPLAALMLAILEGLIIFDALGDDATRTGALAGAALELAAGRGTVALSPESGNAT
ncbi:MAG: TetR/AcrR family transcriptional regulator [Roseiflexaceae bacterium]|nr:TetR/AcrR family transcriptional regulator [Roseiflexaceae bacterium]